MKTPKEYKTEQSKLSQNYTTPQNPIIVPLTIATNNENEYIKTLCPRPQIIA